MTRLLEWLLGVPSIHLQGGHGFSLRWQILWPVWSVVLIAVGLAAFILLVYRREGGGPWRRVVGGALRAVLVLLVFCLMLQPLLVFRRTRVEPSHVVLLVDASASMGVSDRYPSGPTYEGPAKRVKAYPRTTPQTTGGRAVHSEATDRAATTTAKTTTSTSPGFLSELSNCSRLEVLTACLSCENGEALRGLASRNGLAVYSFSDRITRHTVPTGREPLDEALTCLANLQAKGTQTDVVAALQEVLSENRSGRLSGIILASDGRNTRSGDVEGVVRMAVDANVPIHTVLVGVPGKRRDVIVGPSDAEGTVFVRDPIAVRTRIAVEGFDVPVPLTVQLCGEDGRILDQQVVTLGSDQESATVETRYRPESPGRIRMRIQVPTQEGEADSANNVDAVEVDVIEERIRVLYVDGYPRYEYRYLKNMLIREQTVTASCLLLSADDEFVQEGTEPIRRFPGTADELKPFNVVVFGDVNPRAEWLSESQAELLTKWVGDQGGGFVMIAGPRWSPHAYGGTLLERLVPVKSSADTGRVPDSTAPFQLRQTPEGRHSHVFRFESDPNANDSLLAGLPEMYWFARTQGAKPGVEVLAEHPTVRTVEDAMPLVVAGRYGAGTTIFVGVEETWRWRRGVGSVFFDAFWLHLIRYAARHQLLGRDRGLVLSADRTQYEPGDPVVLTLRSSDPQEQMTTPDRVTAFVTDAAGRLVTRVALNRLGKGSSTHEGTFRPPRSGNFIARLEADATIPGQPLLSVTIRVESAGPEMRRVEPDHDLLKQLASRTGGLAVGVGEIGRISEHLEDRRVHIPDDVARPLWDTKLVLILFTLIIGTEWVWRKVSGMV